MFCVENSKRLKHPCKIPGKPYSSFAHLACYLAVHLALSPPTCAYLRSAALDKALAEGVQNWQTIDQQATKIKEGREALIALEQQMLEAIDQLQQEVHADLLCWRASLPVKDFIVLPNLEYNATELRS
jgi:hypothetical protein